MQGRTDGSITIAMDIAISGVFVLAYGCMSDRMGNISGRLSPTLIALQGHVSVKYPFRDSMEMEEDQRGAGVVAVGSVPSTRGCV